VIAGEALKLLDSDPELSRDEHAGLREQLARYLTTMAGEIG